MTEQWKKISDHIYEKTDAAGNKEELHWWLDQLILDLEDFQFSETFEFSEDDRNLSEKIIGVKIPSHSKRIHCVGKWDKYLSVRTINSNKSFNYIHINFYNDNRKAVFGDLDFRGQHTLYFEVGVTTEQFYSILAASNKLNNQSSLTVKIPAFRYPVERSFSETHEMFYIEEKGNQEAQLVSLNVSSKNEIQHKLTVQKNIKEEKEKFLASLKIQMFADKEEINTAPDGLSWDYSAVMKKSWHHQDPLEIFQNKDPLNNYQIADVSIRTKMSALCLEYLKKPDIWDSYIDWVFLDFFIYNELAEFGKSVKLKKRRNFIFLKNKDYQSSIKLWLEMRGFYELLTPPLINPDFIKQKIIESYNHGARWGWDNCAFPLAYKMAQSNPEFMVVEAF